MGNDNIEYMIIPTREIRRRLKKNIIRYMNGDYFELRLWLMDGHLYETTFFGLESEWYYLSKSIGGRMIHTTIWNYTNYLNKWTPGFRE
jgi:hypothetical protein